MDANVEHFLSAQHCLAIAAAFIAIIAACATLITSANNKAESLANRIRETTKEYRANGESARCQQLLEQLSLFQRRFRKVQQAQRLLFTTIGTFIFSLFVFIALGLYILYFNVPADAVANLARAPLLVIGLGVSVGTGFMLSAISLQFWEVGKSYATLCIETRDCESSVGSEASASPRSGLAANA